ncbi:hypothetical protein ABIC27_000016 [Streptomyces sp. PvR034]
MSGRQECVFAARTGYEGGFEPMAGMPPNG